MEGWILKNLDAAIATVGKVDDSYRKRSNKEGVEHEDCGVWQEEIVEECRDFEKDSGVHEEHNDRNFQKCLLSEKRTAQDVQTAGKQVARKYEVGRFGKHFFEVGVEGEEFTNLT